MCPNLTFPVDLVTFTEEILHGKLHFLCSVSSDILEKSMRIVSSPHLMNDFSRRFFVMLCFIN